MKTWVEYYEKGYVTGKIIPACGDRSIVQLDSRNKPEQWILDGIKFSGFRRKNYVGFKIIKGSHLLCAKPVTTFIPLFNKEK